MESTTRDYYVSEFNKLHIVRAHAFAVAKHSTCQAAESIVGLSVVFDNWVEKPGIYDLYDADDAITLLDAARRVNAR